MGTSNILKREILPELTYKFNSLNPKGQFLENLKIVTLNFLLSGRLIS